MLDLGRLEKKRFHLYGVQGVGGSNPLAPTNAKSRDESHGFFYCASGMVCNALTGAVPVVVVTTGILGCKLPAVINWKRQAVDNMAAAFSWASGGRDPEQGTACQNRTTDR